MLSRNILLHLSIIITVVLYLRVIMSLVMIVLWLFQLVTFQKSLVELMSKITVADPMFVRYVYNSQRLLTQS